MLAHAADFRSEVVKELGSTSGPWPAGFDAAGAEAALLSAAPLSFAWPRPMDTLLPFAIKLTASPGALRRADLAPLRAAGLGDLAIHDAVQAIAYFNYINRVADGLGVDLEPEMAADPRDTRSPEPAGDTAGG